MASHLNFYPDKMAANRLYKHLMAEFLGTGTKWNKYDLQSSFGSINVDELVEEKFVSIFRHEFLKMSFETLGSSAYKILEKLQDDIFSFNELLEVLPINIRTVSFLKNQLTFLCNFKQIEYLISPSSGITYFSLDNERFEDDIDELFEHADLVEPAFQYRIDIDQHSLEYNQSLYLDPTYRK